MANRSARQSIFIDFLVDAIGNKQAVMPGVKGDPFRIPIAIRAGAEEGPAVIRGTHQSIPSWVQIIDSFATIFSDEVMSIDGIPGDSSRFVCHWNDGRGFLRNVGCT